MMIHDQSGEEEEKQDRSRLRFNNALDLDDRAREISWIYAIKPDVWNMHYLMPVLAVVAWHPLTYNSWRFVRRCSPSGIVVIPGHSIIHKDLSNVRSPTDSGKHIILGQFAISK